MHPKQRVVFPRFFLSIRHGVLTVLCSHPGSGSEHFWVQVEFQRSPALYVCIGVWVCEWGLLKCFWRHWGSVCPSIPEISGGTAPLKGGMLGLWKCNQHACACFHTALNGIPDSRKLISDKLQKTQTKWSREVVIILKGGTLHRNTG